MVVRTRFRALLVPLALYVASGAMSAYFLQTALNGERGLKTKEDYKQHVVALRLELGALQDERAHWQHRVSLMRSDALDRDLAAEAARARLDYVDPRDLVVFLDGTHRH